MQNNPLDQVKSTIILLIFLGVMILVIPLLASVVFGLAGDSLSKGGAFTLENLLLMVSYLAIGGLLWAVSQPQREELAMLLVDLPDRDTRREYIWLAVGMVIASIGFTYLFFYPLSLLSPALVERWLLNVPYLLYWDEEGIYLLGNLAGVVMAVVLAPVLEELLFRGFLLNRWTLKLGARHALILSSSLFAVLHNDILGAFVFAVLMALLYMKTRTLIAPILVHMANNALAVMLEWLDRSMLSGFNEASVAEFQSYWWLGLLCMLVGFPWLWRYVHRHFWPLSALLAEHEQGGKHDYLA